MRHTNPAVPAAGAMMGAMPDAPCPSFATAQVQAGYDPAAVQHASVPPIYQSNAYEFASLDEARDLFALRREGNVYSRTGNPTAAVLEQRVATLEGGVGAVSVGSGQAAVALSLLTLARQSEHIVAAHQLYGGTIYLLADTFADWGIEVTFVDQDDPEAWRAAVRPTTRAFFAETVANPLAQVLDVRTVADIAHEAGVPLVIDNTVATPYLQRPKQHGADIVVHSATKFIGGHGAALGGLVVDLGTFDFAADAARWPQLNTPLARVPGPALVEQFGPKAYLTLLRTKYSQDIGPSLSAFNAFQLLQGLESLDLRMARHSSSAQTVAEALDAHPAVARVHHPGLPASPWHAAADRYLPRGAASVFSFELHPGRDADDDFARAAALIDRLQVAHLVANIGDARTLVAHPASMTHSHLSPEQLAAGGISTTTIRLSIGLEDPADIVADLTAALDAVR